MTSSSSYHNLKKYCYFSSLSDNALEIISKKLKIVEFPAGTEIIREGDSADAFYLVRNGEVEVSQKKLSGKSSLISIKGHGEGFGEMALLTCSPRIATVTAKTDVVLFRLLKAEFEEIVRMDSSFSLAVQKKVKDYQQFSTISSMEPFAHLDPEKIPLLFERFEERSYSPGENIITQGEKGDLYFIIKKGRVAVFKKMLEERPERVALLSDGEAFGEEALITDSPRNATVQTIADTTLWTLSRQDFDEIMKSSFLEEISAQDILDGKEEKSFLDVRMQMEFDEEHIKDAVNIPLDDLRTRYSELDRSKEYHVYCLLGARSASASFLLRSKGFRAKSIKGGILNWPGPVVESVHTEGVHAPGHAGGTGKPFKPT
jgi:CRP-like cAMP-binding protein